MSDKCLCALFWDGKCMVGKDRITYSTQAYQVMTFCKLLWSAAGKECKPQIFSHLYIIFSFYSLLHIFCQNTFHFFFFSQHNLWIKIFHKPTYCEDSKLLGCYTMLLGGYLLTFWMQYDHSKHQLLFTNGHEQHIPKDQIFSNNTERMSNPAHITFLETGYLLYAAQCRFFCTLVRIFTHIDSCNCCNCSGCDFLQLFHVKNGKEWCKLMAGIQWSWGTIAITR
jgi:hypothetical protein